MMADDFSGVGARHRLMAKQDRMRDEFLDELPADPLRWVRVVIAQHPDETMRLRHGVQPVQFTFRQSAGTLRVMKRIAKRNDDPRFPAA